MRDVSSQGSFDSVRGRSEIKATLPLIPGAGRLCEVRHTISVIRRSQLREGVMRRADQGHASRGGGVFEAAAVAHSTRRAKHLTLSRERHVQPLSQKYLSFGKS